MFVSIIGTTISITPYSNMTGRQFWRQFAIFGGLALAFMVVGVYAAYLQRILHIRWRRWLTERFLRDWLDDQAYYRMQLNQATTDNPDQRIAEDLNRFATITLGLSLGLLSAVVTLVSFLSILWTLSGALTIPLGGTASIAIPGYMVFAALIYAVDRHGADAMDRSTLGPAQFRPAALRGRFSL